MLKLIFVSIYFLCLLFSLSIGLFVCLFTYASILYTTCPFLFSFIRLHLSLSHSLFHFFPFTLHLPPSYPLPSLFLLPLPPSPRLTSPSPLPPLTLPVAENWSPWAVFSFIRLCTTFSFSLASPSTFASPSDSRTQPWIMHTAPSGLLFPHFGFVAQDQASVKRKKHPLLCSVHFILAYTLRSFKPALHSLFFPTFPPSFITSFTQIFVFLSFLTCLVCFILLFVLYWIYNHVKDI